MNFEQWNGFEGGIQTRHPLERGVNPFGGIRMARSACEAYGYHLSHKVEEEFTYRTTHNDGVFRAYTDEMRKARHAGVITGLPDAYGRGRIIGDYRRVALYGVDALIAEKKADKARIGEGLMNADTIRQTEELFQQIAFLGKLKEMAQMYGFDISAPASTAKEAIQLMDHFVMKLRMARHLRTPDYNELFGGDPMWITESVGGVGEDGRPLVTKNSFRVLHTLYTLGPAPEPNLTVLWSENLPEPFKKFCAKVSIDTDSIQYENDDLMRPVYGDDYGIACCVSAMKIGKQMQFFGARCNLPKLLLLALNGGHDQLSGTELGPKMEPYPDEYLDYGKVMERLEIYRKWLCRLYVNTMNVIHYMHNRETHGALASLNSVAKMPYEKCRDGISNTFSITPSALGRSEEERVDNLVQVLGGYFRQMAHHLNVNVMNRQQLVDAYNDPARYPNLTIRVSGYAVNFHKLSREQQREVISRTFHESM